MSNETDLTKAAVALAVDNFEQTRGGVPDGFKLLLEHAPAAFAGYGLMRQSVVKEGALDLKTKELIFTLIDVVIGETNGAKVHAANAVTLGLPVEALTEGLVQCILAVGITSWNRTGKAVLEHALAVRGEMQGSAAKP